MEPVKTISRNKAGLAEMESYRPELLTDEEPRYLRRQRPVEIRRKKFAGRGWSFYRKVAILSVAGIASVTVIIEGMRFLLYSPQFALTRPDQIDLTGNKIVSREAVLKQFLRDRNHSVLQIPLDKRRSELEQLPWVESASVQRILPNRIRVELYERTPIAFARTSNALYLIDAHGVILDRPEGEDWHFPIVSGVSEELPRDQREKRMQMYQDFMKAIELVRSGSSDQVSEVDLSSTRDFRAVMVGLAGPTDPQAVTIHFGGGDFAAKYRMLVENFSQWQANAGRVRSIDLQYSRQVILNPDSSAGVAVAKAR
jgi:cell division protein FtsQ